MRFEFVREFVQVALQNHAHLRNSSVPTSWNKYWSRSPPRCVNSIGVVLHSNVTSLSVPNEQCEARELVMRCTCTWRSNSLFWYLNTLTEQYLCFQCSPREWFKRLSGNNIVTGGSETTVGVVAARRSLDGLHECDDEYGKAQQMTMSSQQWMS